MANTLAASDANEPTRFSSLPIDIVWKILAHVPKRDYPILCCVSKNFRYLVLSPEIHRIRSLLSKDSLSKDSLSKDSLYICFIDETNSVQTRNWFTLRRVENNRTEDQLVSVDLVFPYHHQPYPSTVAIGPEIFFIFGSYIPPSSSLYIYDSRSGKLREGPSMKVDRSFNIVGLVGRRIYVIGGYRDDEIQAESFDLKMQTWEPAPIPEAQGSWISAATVSLDRKVCVLMNLEDMAVCYNIKDGSCESFELPKSEWCETGVCVIHNVLYVYYARLGLLWYDSKLMLWRVVNGLNSLNNVRSVGMAEYYGKIAFLWVESSHVCSETNDIWCRMISLDRSEVGIHGTAEQPQLMGIVPRGYRLQHFLSLSD